LYLHLGESLQVCVHVRIKFRELKFKWCKWKRTNANSFYNLAQIAKAWNTVQGRIGQNAYSTLK
jgi:hypothetical protein